MAQTGYTPILIYSSSTTTNAPAVGNLTNSTLGSELAINITDGKLFYKDNANAIQVIAWKTTPTTAGGTGLTSYTAGDLLYYATGTTLSKLAIGASGRWLGSSGTAPQWNAPAALTKTDDTNVTLTLGGSASTALLNAASLTLGWTGTLATTRGGTGLSSFTANGIVYASSTSALTTSSLLNFTSGNLGVDATPAPWSWPTGATGTIQIREGGAFSGYNAGIYLSNNWYYNAGEKFIGNGYAMRYDQTTGKHVWYVSNASNAGGAGAGVTWLQVMQTHASTGVSIGNTTDPGAACLNVGSGGTSSANTGFATINGSSATNFGPVLRFNTNGSFLADTGDYANIVGSATHQYAVRCGASGGVYLAATGTSWSAVSDENQKNIIEPIVDGLNKIASLRTVIGSYKSDELNARHPFLIAQDVQKVLPEAVTENDNADGVVLGLSYTDMIPLLVNAIQELKQQFDAYVASHP